jgi:hypothetical protein
MDEPSSLTTAFRVLLLFLGAFGLPQTCGMLSLRWAIRKKRKIILIPALLVAPAIFFAAAYVFWGMQAESIRADGRYVCGAFGAGALFSTIWGTAIHLGISGAVLFFMWFAVRRRNRLLGGPVTS